MTDDMNGAQLLLDRIDTELSKKRLPSSTRILLEAQQYNLKYTVRLRSDVRTLREHDIIQKMKDNKKLSVVIFLTLFLLNGLINWAGIRKPIIQAIVYQSSGILVPLDAIP